MTEISSSRSDGSSRRGSSSAKYVPSSSSVPCSHSSARVPSSSAKCLPSSSSSASRAAQAAGTSDCAASNVRPCAGRSNSCSSTACTRVPRVAAGLGGSGSRSITRKRYSRGHDMKSPALEGLSDTSGRAVSDGTGSSGGSAATSNVVMGAA